MCGRMGLTRRDLDELVDELEASVSDAVRVEYRPRYNVAPTDRHPVLRLEDGGRRLEMLRWGLDGGARGLHINARAATARFKPAFRDAFAQRRCVVPADGFYEWRDKQPFWFRRGDGKLLLFAGLWDGERFCVLTTEPNRVLAEVHDRMPVVLAPADVPAWLATPAQELLRPCADDVLTGTPVSTRVNSVKNDDPACLDPPAGGGQLALFRL